ncbi:MAG: Cystathionine beta-synthase, partial [uncultured Sphingomonadaceae bacterium]
VRPAPAPAHRQYPPRAPRRSVGGDRVRDPGEVRVHEPGWLGEGPRGVVHRRGSGSARRDRARRNARRGHCGQHRHWARAGSERQGLPLHHRDAGDAEPGEDGHAARARRGARAGRARALFVAVPLRPPVAAHRGGDGGGAVGEPVRQHRQPDGAHPHDRAGNLGADGGPSGRLHLRSGNGRYAGGRGAGAEGAATGGHSRADGPARGGAVQLLSRGRAEGGGEFGGGGDRAEPDHRQPGGRAGGRPVPHLRPRGVGAGAGATRRGAVLGAVVGHQRRGGDGAGQGAGAGQDDRDDPVRQRDAVPVDIVQRGLAADEGAGL